VTPGARIAAAIEILDAIDRGTAPADTVVRDYFQRRRYAGSKDRRAIQDRVWGVLRRRGTLLWRLGADRTGVEARALVLADLAEEGLDAATLCDGVGHAPPPLTSAEKGLLASRSDGQAPDWARLNYPDWLDGPLRRALADARDAEMAALNREAPVDLRVNALKATRDEAQAALAAEGVEAAPAPLSPLGLRIERRQPLRGLKALRDGLVEPQEEGSQILALVVGARPGETVIDYCAGAGGKTLALAAAMANEGRLVAGDIAAARLRRMAPRLDRAGVENVERLVLPAGLAEGAADRLLVDAPCSGLGTWRRKPELRWRLTPDGLAADITTQHRLLRDAARLVRPGGRLVYATCSLLQEENDDPVAAFLAETPTFRRLPIAGVWQETIGGAAPCDGPDLLLTPARHGTDGVYAAVLERAP